ncbi:MAG: hypothetical protein K9J37_15050 [Saprospiraceae bacterium]|nr:hypothetical protein [Saprospiraceae bacterium]MCF8251227.1 hypothetical protein [Saprospiraceae bacterium]MCF8281211.1 hypothetical protein [Bacteroidales bacterium]MCF8313149.1 hypothetical protein [Saprospiraceae bacterium]MCF8441589.1 hypothetical protein [Saprospiraceae bacterium]
MRNVLKINLLLLVLCLVRTLGAQPTEGHFIQTFNTTRVEVVQLAQAENLTVKSWKSGHVQIEIFVELKNGGGEATLRNLAAQGRYSLCADRSPGKLWLGPKFSNSTINAAKPLETVRYVVWVPEGLTVEREVADALVGHE